MSDFQNIVDVLVDFGEEQVKDLNASLTAKGFNSGGQTADIGGTIKFDVKLFGTKITYQMSIADYYIHLDQGRGPTRGGGTGEVRRSIREWLTTKGINPVGVMQGIFAKSGKKPPKNFGFQQARESLTAIITRKIHKQGTIARFGARGGVNGPKGSNFYSDVVTQARLDQLQKDLIEATKEDVIIEIGDIKKDFEQ